MKIPFAVFDAQGKWKGQCYSQLTFWVMVVSLPSTIEPLAQTQSRVLLLLNNGREGSVSNKNKGREDKHSMII